MRITTITVRNYRVHREVTIACDASRTLIGGLNESGKSTFAEAVHRALFLRARTGGEAQKAMVSTLHPGHPEVEVDFTARGKSWHLHKQFRGANGTVTLTETAGGSWTGDDAETKLAELLGVSEATGGKGGAKAADQQWGHLWVWQGKAGEDPVRHANTQRDHLLARLQSDGGAAAMQSALDAKTAAAVAAACAGIYSKHGTARAGSALKGAQMESEEAAQKLEIARQQAARLEQAVSDFRSAEEQIRVSTEALQSLEPQQKEVEIRSARITELRRGETAQAAELARVREKWETLTKAEQDIRELRGEIDRFSRAIAPAEAAVQQAMDHETRCREREVQAEQACTMAGEQERTARLRSELATAYVQRIEKGVQRDELRTRHALVVQARGKRAALEKELAEMTPVTPAVLKKLQALDRDCSTAEAALAAMAAGLEVIVSDRPVDLDGRTLHAGESCIITEDAEVTVGETTRLRIRPGGGNGLADARQRVQGARIKRQRALDELGLSHLSAAVEAEAQRQRLESELKTVEAGLDGMGAGTIDDALAKAEAAAISAEAEVARRSATLTDVVPPENTGAAGEFISECNSQLRQAEGAETTARAERDAAANALREATQQLGQKRQALQKERQEITDREAQLRLLLQTHGDDATRTGQTAGYASARDAAEAALTQTKQALAALQPDLLPADRARLERAVKEQTEARARAEQTRAGAQSLLRSDGTFDPQADLALAEARARDAAARCTAEERRARAVQLLHELFLTEQQTLADQFTRPLAERISGYLECLFGTGARAEVRLENHEFTALQLIRPSHAAGAFEFDTLSGGAREQLAAAVRLAMAEVLAEAHEGCLPLVFDDAFTSADPLRVQTLQRMLDLAAARGLQVIVLTCNPADYSALGAKQILLPAPGVPLP